MLLQAFVLSCVLAVILGYISLGLVANTDFYKFTDNMSPDEEDMFIDLLNKQRVKDLEQRIKAWGEKMEQRFDRWEQQLQTWKQRIEDKQSQKE